VSVTGNVGDWRGHDVFGADGNKIGKLEDVYYDATSDEAVLLCVRSGKLTHKQVLIPVLGARVTPEQVVVKWREESTDGAPTTKPDEELSVEDEERVFHHYGLDYVPPVDGQRTLKRH
jgi:uncharacterized protein YrrD